MVRCPRCRNETERLHPLPREALTTAAMGRDSDGTPADPKACRWCLHEITEG